MKLKPGLSIKITTFITFETLVRNEMNNLNASDQILL